MAAPLARHCRLVVGAGLPLQLPALTLTAVPILPVPLSAGAVTSAGRAANVGGATVS